MWILAPLCSLFKTELAPGRAVSESTSFQARPEPGQAQTVTTPILQETGNQFTSLKNRTDKTPKIGDCERGAAQVSPVAS